MREASYLERTEEVPKRDTVTAKKLKSAPLR
jgi:hypothetical protein